MKLQACAGGPAAESSKLQDPIIQSSTSPRHCQLLPAILLHPIHWQWIQRRTVLCACCRALELRQFASTVLTMFSQLHGRSAELKSQGAAEAAQDPDSSVTSQDAQHVMAAESKKAGVDAFEFDPDASPEAKAAQARSVSRFTTD